MKTNLYYFSGTGNSLAVSKHLAIELEKDKKNIVEVIPIAKFNSESTVRTDADIVGIVFPVYCHDVPNIVREFSKKINLNGAYTFGIATYNKEPGNSLFNLNSLLEENGSNLSAGFEISMPGNSVLVMDLTRCRNTSVPSTGSWSAPATEFAHHHRRRTHRRSSTWTSTPAVLRCSLPRLEEVRYR